MASGHAIVAYRGRGAVRTTELAKLCKVNCCPYIATVSVAGLIDDISVLSPYSVDPYHEREATADRVAHTTAIEVPQNI
jgi:hypothetical protein